MIDIKNGNTLYTLVEAQDFYIAVGILAGVCVLLIIAVCVLIKWLVDLSKKLEDVRSKTTFSIGRPKLIDNPYQQQQQQPSQPNFPSARRSEFNDYSNSAYSPSSPPAPYTKPSPMQPPPPMNNNSNNPMGADRFRSGLNDRNFSYGPGPSAGPPKGLPSENSRFANERFY